jgi:thiol-disulfide isomerase/thioredoxin
LKCETLDNEKWQPGISAFAKALADTNDPHKVISAMKNIIAFAGVNRDTPIGEYLKWYLEFSGKVVGKSVWEILEFDKDAQWFNSGGLKKEDLEGKVFMLEFWATWCGPCAAAAPKIARLYDELNPQGFIVVGVSQDQDITAEEMQVFLKDHGTNYPIYWDKTAKVTLSFEIEGIPHTVLVGRDGTILWEGMPYDEKYLRELILSALKADETKNPPEKNQTEGTVPTSSSDKPANP